MAIPFNLPSDEETEDTYRRIDQLLLDLYDLLRQIILRQRTVRREDVPTETSRVTAAAPMQNVDGQTQTQLIRADLRLPDVVADSLPLVRKTSIQPTRRRRRRQEKTSRRCHHNGLHRTPYDGNSFPRFPGHFPSIVQQQQPSSSSWLNVGIELRQIAEEITFIARNGNSTTTKRRSEIKASSLFSLLVPAPITGTIWTTVIILVGWRLLTKQR